jgi:hypothetical protein
VEETGHLEDVEETLDAPSVEDWERSEYEDICSGVRGESTERNRTQQLQCRQLGPDLEELSSELVDGTHDWYGVSLFDY